MEPRTKKHTQKNGKKNGKKPKKKQKKTLKRNPEAKCMVCTWLKNEKQVTSSGYGIHVTGSDDNYGIRVIGSEVVYGIGNTGSDVGYTGCKASEVLRSGLKQDVRLCHRSCRIVDDHMVHDEEDIDGNLYQETFGDEKACSCFFEIV